MPHSPSRHWALAAAVSLAIAIAAAPPAPAQEQLSQRLSQLEEQIVDLQVAIGTLQSLRGAQAPEAEAAHPFADPSRLEAGSDTALRVEAMETQIRALTGQIEHLGAQLAALHARLDGGHGGTPPAERRGELAPLPHDFAGPPEPPPADPQASGFGATTVLPWATQWSDAPRPQEQLAALPGGDARDIYDDAYGYLLARDYDSAEIGFRRFLEAHPDDPLAGDAQYWLGETHFVRAQYKRAADAFLQSYRLASTGPKAPDSLLKLGMSLNHIGERDAACDTLAELAGGFPDAPEHVRQRAAMEGRRAGC